MIKKNISFQLFCFLILGIGARASTCDELWLNYRGIVHENIRFQYREQIRQLSVPGTSATDTIIRNELIRGLSALLDRSVPLNATPSEGSLLVIKAEAAIRDQGIRPEEMLPLGKDGFLIRTLNRKKITLITANSEIGLLYGSFHLLKLLQTEQPIDQLNVISIAKTHRRILNHWDNLDRTSERGYAGFSIWDWHRLPDYLDPRYAEYARANASIGINGTVLNNVNANALILTPYYLEKVKALADLFRPYGIRVYLTARFSAPMEIGGLATADPLDEDVQNWWKSKTEEIYQLIPDFGGFLVKANSEGQPGPQNYGRSHVDGANLLARALAPHDGIVMWRAFVYSDEEPEDRAKQAYNEFVPLDGQFLPNVMVQVKNGPIDFQPREPFHPMFGAMPQTPLMMEFQITQEYLGQATQLVFLAPMYEEVLQSDTYAHGPGSTVARVIDGSLDGHSLTGMAGVANIGTDKNWTGHPMAQANWYAFGRLAWDPELASGEIAREWTRRTFGNNPDVFEPVTGMLMASYEAAVSYMTPLGLHHIMGTGHHYGPAPWVDHLSRADWNPVYYHRADSLGLGFDRTPTGSNAVAQYFPEVANLFGDLSSCPESLLLWFHHVRWDHPLRSGRTLWEELCYKYQSGIECVRKMKRTWETLEEKIDPETFRSVTMLLQIQEKEATWWKDACLLYFRQFSGRPFPEFLEPPQNTLEHYQSLQFPFAPGN